ncbi:prepilin peptidase [Kytococcus sedentarius]|nr:A24 family peptidase [Kytococcus sedentarius]QQB64238.1 prepilin peptidase [Kytococcus sedentarius]
MPMTALFLACLTGTLGLLATGHVRGRLAGGAHRRPEDPPSPVPRFGWLPWVAAVGVAVPAALGAPLLQAAAEGHRPGLPVVLLGCLGVMAVVAGATASAIDLDVHRLPDRLTLPAAATCLLVLVGVAAADGAWDDLRRAVLAAMTLGVGYCTLSFLTAGGIGLGDAKLALSIGLFTGWLGWGPFLLAAWGAFAVGALVAVVLMVAGRATRATQLPFGPSMVCAAWATWVLTLAPVPG